MVKVYDYFLVGDNYIKGYQRVSVLKRPDLINNPNPTQELIDYQKINNDLKDKYGNYVFKMVDLNIIRVDQTPTTEQTVLQKLKKINVEKLLRALVDGIESRGTAPNYIKLRNALLNINDDLGDI